MNKTYIDPYRANTTRPWFRISLVATAALLFGIAALLGTTEDAEATRQTTIYPIATQSGQLLIPPPSRAIIAAPSVTQSEAIDIWTTVEIESGDNLSVIFNRLNISPQVLAALTAADNKGGSFLSLIRPGQQLKFLVKDGQLEAMDYLQSQTQSTHYIREDGGYRVWDEVKDTEVRISTMVATIKDSLYVAGQQSGLSDNLIMELVGIFGWDIDFALDIRSGDSFSLVYEEHFLEGDKLRDGSILAAEFNNQGHIYTAILHRADDGSSNYYSPSGDSMRKAFLRSPVDFRRISSGFSKERFHPVLGKKRPHRGVDYAAATGTPIKASGDGKVIFKGTKGGYGRTLILQHGGKFTTLYAHMSKYQRSIKQGSRVKQGETIGYVGKSGLATGPHLHYEFRVNGEHRNPVKVKFPNAAPIAKVYQESFKEQARHMSALLQMVKDQLLASNQ